MAKTLPVWIALLLVVGTGVSESLWTNRWSASKELQAAVARLEDFPSTVGDWEGHSDQLDARQLELGEIEGYASYRYVNRRNGNAVSVLAVCGRPGPISVHTPDICYRGAGYEPIGAPVKLPLEGAGTAGTEFWMSNFSKPSPGASSHLRVFWAWSAAGAWQAPDNPRLRFARYSALYKLYVIRQVAAPDEPVKGDPSVEFMQLLLPRLQQTLFPAS